MDIKLTKDELCNVLAIMMDMDDFQGQFKKMSIPALEKMYDRLNQNAMAYNVAKKETHHTKEHLAIAERRIASLERDLNKTKGKAK